MPTRKNPPRADFWDRPFFDPFVQRILREGRAWKFEQPYLGSYLHAAMDVARAFSENPTKYFEDASDLYLREWGWASNGWFFRLCAAICDVNARPEKAVLDRIFEAWGAVPRPECKPIIGDGGDSLLPDFSDLPDPSFDEIAFHLQKMYPIRCPLTAGAIRRHFNRERKRQQKIIDDWNAWHPSFFRGVGIKELYEYICPGWLEMKRVSESRRL